MTLIKTTVYTGISTSIKLVSGFLLNKVIAYLVGPTGFAALGQFRNFVTIGTTFSSGASNTGLIKYIAENDDIDARIRYIKTAVSSSLILSFVFSVLLLVFRNNLSLELFNTTDFSYLFVIFALTVVFFSLNSVFLSVLNGTKQIRLLTLANIANSVTSLIITLILVVWLHLPGALIALVISQSIVFFITVLFVHDLPWFKSLLNGLSINKSMLIQLMKFSLITITSVITGPVALIVIRNTIATEYSWETAGYWEALWQLSAMYLSFVTTSLSVYYLPKLSEIKKVQELRMEISRVARLVIPFVILLSTMIYLFRRPITIIVFSRDFLPIVDYFLFQLIGDVLKISSWLLSFVFIAKAMIKETVITSIMANILFVLLVKLLIPLFGFQGVMIAYAVNYFIYAVVVAVTLKIRHFDKAEKTV